MDRKLSENPEIQRLIQLSAASRVFLESEAEALRKRLDFPARARQSLKEHPTAWLFGSLGAGLAASLLFRKKSVTAKKRRGIPGVLMGLTLTAARPLAKVWLANLAKQWVAELAATHNARIVPPRPVPTSKSS
jgi:hypothetical protein